MSNIKKIKNNISKIRKVVEKQGRYSFYLLDDNEVKLVAKGDNLREIKNDVIKKIEGKSRYIDCPIYQVEVHIDEKYVEKPHKLDRSDNQYIEICLLSF